MHIINRDLGQHLSRARIEFLADSHKGDPGCKKGDIIRHIERVEERPDTYLILNGDLINNALTSSVSDTYCETVDP